MDRLAYHLTNLSEKITRSLATGNGIRLTSFELDMLISLGLFDLVSDTLGEEIKSNVKAGSTRRLERIAAVAPKIDPDFSRPVAPVGQKAPLKHHTGKAEVYTPATLATRWGVSKGYVEKRLKNGELPHFRIGQLYRIRPDVVAEFEAANAHELNLPDE